MNNQELLALRRMEGVEWKITAMDNNLNRVLLIFGLLMALALFLMINYHRAQTRLLSERVNRAARESEELMRDIQRDLLRPEMEFLRIGHFLRDLMRRFFESPPEAGEVMQARSFARDPNLPVALHCIAQTLVAEYEKRWPDAVASLERLRHLEPKDPLALLHLSAAHRRLSARHHERRDKQRHLKLSNQLLRPIRGDCANGQPPVRLARQPARLAVCIAAASQIRFADSDSNAGCKADFARAAAVFANRRAFAVRRRYSGDCIRSGRFQTVGDCQTRRGSAASADAKRDSAKCSRRRQIADSNFADTADINIVIGCRCCQCRAVFFFACDIAAASAAGANADCFRDCC